MDRPRVSLLPPFLEMGQGQSPHLWGPCFCSLVGSWEWGVGAHLSCWVPEADVTLSGLGQPCSWELPSLVSEPHIPER